MKNILVSILSVEDKVGTIAKLKETGVGVHLDIMDGKFVKPLGVKLDIVQSVKQNNLFCDVHLMVSKPLEDGYISKALGSGADSITIHYEIEEFERVLRFLLLEKNKRMHEGRNLEIGVAINPKTSVDVLTRFYKLIDKVLVMSVEPGYGGQKYIESTDMKIDKIKKQFGIKVEVDGGINKEIIKKDVMKYVDDFVIGSYITGSDNMKDRINLIKEEIK